MLLNSCRMAISSHPGLAALSTLSHTHFKCKWNSVVTHTTGSVCTSFSSSPAHLRALLSFSPSGLFLKRYIPPYTIVHYLQWQNMWLYLGKEQKSLPKLKKNLWKSPMESIAKCSVPFSLMWYTFVNSKYSDYFTGIL